MLMKLPGIEVVFSFVKTPGILYQENVKIPGFFAVLNISIVLFYSLKNRKLVGTNTVGVNKFGTKLPNKAPEVSAKLPLNNAIRTPNRYR